MKIVLPPNYEYRYTLNYLVQRHSLETGKEIRDIHSEMADLMNLKTRMVRYYRTEAKDSKRKELSTEVLIDLGAYFGVDPEQLITKNVLVLSDDVSLATEATS